MNEWVLHPAARTALDDILPCVDVATANESLYRSREVTYQLVSVVNQVINNVSNKNFPPQLQPLYYNQSGPLLPALCNPFNADTTDRACVTGEVDFKNATQVRENLSFFFFFFSCSTVMQPFSIQYRSYNISTDIVNIDNILLMFPILPYNLRDIANTQYHVLIPRFKILLLSVTSYFVGNLTTFLH